MRTLGIVPARGGSQRIPRKNLQVVGGAPLVLRALRTALAATRLARVVVSSDDDEILGLVADLDPAASLRRPSELATSTAPAIGYVRHALAQVEDPSRPYEAVAIIQPSSPFTRPEDIDGCLELLEATAADSVVTVVELDHAFHPSKMKSLDGDRLVPLLMEEQGRTMAHELPPVYVRNGSVYACSRRAIDRGDLLGGDSRAVPMPRSRSLDLNSEFDLELARFLLSRQP